MTQDYAPIELNENTSEPTADGIYLLTITVGDETRTYPATKEGDMWLTDGDCTWKDLLSEMSQADRVTIQSLAAHDAQMQAEAWDEGQQAEKGYQDWASEAGGDTELMEDPEEPTNPYRKDPKQ